MKHNPCFSRLRANFWLLVSTAAALCLFLLPSKMTILLEAAIFLMVLASSLICPPVQTAEKRRVLPVVLAAVFSAIGFRTFVIAWMKSGIMASVAGVLGLPISLLVPAVGLFGAVCAFYAFWRLARWIDRSIGQFLAEPDDNTFRNLKTNGYFLLSAALFFIMENTRTDLFPLGIPVAVLVFAMVAGKIPSLWKMTLDTHPGIRVLSALNALGICWSELFVFRKYWHLTGGERAIPADIWLTAAAVASFPFVYICVALFWRWLWKQIRAGLQQLCRWERGAIVGLMVILMVLTLFAFTRSDTYYGTESPYDILYTSDSHILVEKNRKIEELPADSVIVSIGYMAGNPFTPKKQKHVHILGDANHVANLKAAIWAANDLAIKLSK